MACSLQLVRDWTLLQRRQTPRLMRRFATAERADAPRSWPPLRSDGPLSVVKYVPVHECQECPRSYTAPDPIWVGLVPPQSKSSQVRRAALAEGPGQPKSGPG